MRWAAILMLFMISSSIVTAIGITPGSTNMRFEPGAEKKVTLNVINSEGSSFNALIYTSGELAQYINLSTEELVFEGEAKRSFHYKLKLPDSFEYPGLHSGEIQVVERSDQSGSLNIRPSLGVKHKVFCHVPYPGKYAEYDLNIEDVDKGQPVIFYIKIYNLGTQNLEAVSADLEIIDPSGQVIETLETESKPVGSKEVGELIIRQLTYEMDPGRYTINGSLDYDGEKIPISGSFEVNQFMLSIESISSEDYTAGGITKIKTLLKNIGNREVKDAFTRLVINDQEGNLIDAIRSYRINVGPKELKETEAYWDTRNISFAEYSGRISMNYEDETLEKDVRIILGKEELKINIITGKVVDERPQGDNGLVRYTFIILLLFAIIVMLVLNYKRMRSTKS